VAPFVGTEISPAPATQSVPGTIYNTESGMTFSVASITVAPADSGTRFKAAFNNLPNGVSVWVPTVNAANGTSVARLITGEATAFAPAPSGAFAGAFPVAKVALVNGNGTATWEVLAANPNAIETFDFPVWFTGSGSVNLVGSVDGSLAPNPAQGAISSSGFAAASNSLPIPRFKDPSAAVVSRTFSQIVDGDTWKTTIILVSTDTVPANFRLRFWDERGNPQSFPLTADGVQSQLIGTIPPGGSRTIQTDGTAGSLSVAWGELETANSIGGYAVFRQRVAGRPDQEAAVPLSSRMGRFALPFDNIGFVTAMALVNANPTQTASSTALFRGQDGASISQVPVNLSSRSHTAFALPDLIPGINNRRGVVEFSFTNPDMTALGLRFNSGGAFTSMPVMSFDDPTLGAPNRSLSQLVDGGGWKTTFVLSNMDTTPAAITLRFWRDDGSPLRLQFEGVIGDASETFATTIPVGGSVTLFTRGVGLETSQGWAELSTTNKVGGLSVFRQAVPGRPDQEAAVPLTTSLSHFVLPFDNTEGFVTAMALVNTSGTIPASVSVVIRDEAGLEIGSESLTVGPRGHTAFALPAQFPIVAGRRGIVEFSESHGNLSGLGLRFNPTGAFTSVPVVPK
jgi:hypothetical protein